MKPSTSIGVFPKKSRSKPWTEEETETLKRLMDEGYTVESISRLMQRSKNTLMKYRLQLGPPYSPEPPEKSVVYVKPEVRRTALSDLPVYKPAQSAPTRPGALDFLNIKSKR